MAEINLSPYTAESEAIARRMKMAELLQQQAMQPLETPGMAGGYQLAISPYAGLAKILQGYTAGQAGRSAEAERKALGDRYQRETSEDFGTLLSALTPKPAVPEGAPMITTNIGPNDYSDNPRMTVMPELNEMGEIIQKGQPGAGNYGVTPGTPAIPATTGELSAAGYKAMKTPEGKQQYTTQLLSQIAPKEGMVLPEGASYISKAGKVLIQGAGKEDFHVPKNEFDPMTGQTLTVAYSNKGNRKVIDTKGAYTPDQWNSIPVAERARMVFDQYKFGNVSATDLMQAAQKNVQLGQELAKLGFEIGPNAASGGVRLPTNQPVPVIPANGSQPQATVVPPVQPSPRIGPPQGSVRPVQPIAQPVAPAIQPTAQARPLGVTPKAWAEIQAKQAEAQMEKTRGATTVKGLLTGVEDLIDQAHGGFFGNVYGGMEAALNIRNEANIADSQLNVIAGALTSQMPKMSGPQSDKDVLLYRQMAGDIGNPNISAEAKKAAVATVRGIQDAYINGFSATGYLPRGGRAGGASGTFNEPPAGAVRRIR